MFKKTVVAQIILFVCLSITKCLSASVLKRIHMGEVVSLKDYPFMVNIRDTCAGTLLSSKCVLTAAHCVDPFPVYIIKVYQAIDYDRRAKKYTVHDIIKPINFDVLEKFDMDVAILVLKEPMRNISLVKLDFGELNIDDNVTVIGWGHSDHEYRTKQLNAVNSTVVSHKYCQDQTKGRLITKNMFCVNEEKGPRPCLGDSGGPALRNNRQVGIVSFKKGKENDGKPGVYTRLSSEPVARFILRNLFKNCL